MFENYEEARIYPTDKRGQRELMALLEKEGIRRDGNLEYTLGLYDGDYRLIATGSCYKNTLRCLAVDSAHQGEGLLNRVVSRLMELKADQGDLHLFLYTKCDKAPFFADLGFGEIAREDTLSAALAVCQEVEELQKEGYNVAGPIGADSVFHQALQGRYNSVLSLYHDQGHIATKTLDFERTISITAGMPILRTSVDHGTALDIAGTGKASAVSLIEAVRLAVKYAPNFMR